jgi:hypothetical protein
VVGTVPMLINHGDRIFAGTIAYQYWAEVLLTYGVLFLVSVRAVASLEKDSMRCDLLQ